MFKSILNSINGHPKSSTTKPNEADESPVIKASRGGGLASANGQILVRDRSSASDKIACDGDQQPSAKLNIGKRGRKKILAMMDKLHSSMGSSVGGNASGVPSEQRARRRGSSLREFSELNNNNEPTKGREEDEEEEAESDEPFLDADDGCGQLADFKRCSIDDDDAKGAFLLPEEQCDIPTFLQTKNCDPHLVEETRRLLKERYAKNPDSFYDNDYKRMLTDDWTVSRFLLRRRLDPKRTAKLMEECGRFRKQYKMSEVQLWEFPVEFHKAGGLFMYAPDRVGNVTVYMRVKMYRRVPEISDVFKAFILCVLEQADVANGGRGTAVIFDLSACGLQNVDLSFLSWLLSSFRNYCPKGVSYILVYNLPWILNATCKLAMTWMSASNRRALRFVHGNEIENFIAKENLPDYCGGTCKLDYHSVPAGSLPAIDVCDRLDMTREQALKIRELFKEYLDEEDYEKYRNNSQNKLGVHEEARTGGQLAGPITNGLSLASDNNTHGSPTDLISQASKFVA